jgi:primosomal protein N' (replication factor Y)
LTYHNDTDSLKCHYCDFETKYTNFCNICTREGVFKFGVGTQKVEQEIKEAFPDSSVLRMDKDTTKKRGSHEEILKKFAHGDVDILIGTQMITKGLDIPRVTLVGVIYADLALSLPDFRASEKTFQLLTQVAGRAGRGKKEGKVIIQTFNPEHYSIQFAKSHNYKDFYDYELKSRQELCYPPFSKLIRIKLKGENEHSVENAALSLKNLFENFINKISKDSINILGPTPCPIKVLSNKIRYHLILRSKEYNLLHRLINLSAKYIIELEKKYKINCKIDVDPLTFM